MESANLVAELRSEHAPYQAPYAAEEQGEIDPFDDGT